MKREVLLEGSLEMPGPTSPAQSTVAVFGRGRLAKRDARGSRKPGVTTQTGLNGRSPDHPTAESGYGHADVAGGAPVRLEARFYDLRA